MKFDKMYKLLLQESDEADTATEFEEVADGTEDVVTGEDANDSEPVGDTSDLSPKEIRLMELLGLEDESELYTVMRNKPKALSEIIKRLNMGYIDQETAKAFALGGGEYAPRSVEDEMYDDSVSDIDDIDDTEGTESDNTEDIISNELRAKRDEDSWFRGGVEDI